MELIRNKLFAKAMVILLAIAVTLSFTAIPEPVHADEPTWTVIVKDAEGSPITGYTATLMHEDDNYKWNEFETVTNSNEDGSVSFYRAIPKGDWGYYKLIVTKEGYEDLTFGGDWGNGWDYEEWPENPKTLTMTMAGVTTKKVTVKAVDRETGEEIEGADIKLYNEAFNPKVEVAKDDDGAWYLEVNSDHFFYAYATAEGYKEGMSDGIFAMNTTPEEVTIELDKAVDPLDEAKAEAKEALANYKKDDDFEDKDAVQDIRNEYAGKIDAAESADAVDALLTEAKGKIDEQPLNPPAPYHTLTVIDKDTKEAISGYTAKIRKLRKTYGSALGEVFEVAEDGKFYNKDFDTNSFYKLEVTARGYKDCIVPSGDAYGGYDLKNGLQTLPDTVEMEKAEPVFTLSVKDKDTGKAISSFTATVLEKAYPNDYTEFETNNDGKFYKNWDTWNDYKLTVNAEGYKEKTLNFEYTESDRVYPTEIELEKTEEAIAAEDLAAAKTAAEEAATAKSEAEAAKKEADAAKDAADKAAAKAEESKKAAEKAAKTPGQAAVDAANKAKEDADAAKKAADTAKEKADTAKEKADTAKAKADAAKTAADKAAASAEAIPADVEGRAAAVTAANKAKSDADTEAAIAETAANNANAAADSAKEKVTAAANAVEDAKTTVAKAVAAKEKADAAKEKADAAKKKADATKYIPGKVKILKAKNGKKKATVRWKRLKKNVTGYEIRLTNKKTKKVKTVKVKQGKKKTLKKVVKKLKKGKYTVKVRAINKVGGKTYKGAWSKAKTVKVK